MARSTQVVLIDDVDGGAADETVTFALDGVTYEIDLSKANAAKMRKALSGYVAKARRTGGRKSSRPTGKRSGGGRSRGSASGRDIPAIREWARKKGLLESERGRIPASVIEAYDAANPAS